MGLIKAAVSAIGGTLKDQFLNAISCEDMGNDILMVKKTDENGTLAKGSRIIVAPGQVAVLYDSGKIMDATAESGVYTFDSSTTPSFFGGDFGAVFKEMWERFKFGGNIAKEQAVFFFNIKEIVGNKFGTPNPVAYKDWGHALLNARTGGYTPMRLDIKCFGTYTFKITNPAVFMMNIAGNAEVYRKETLVEQMRSEVVAGFSNVLNSLSEDEYKIEALSLPNKTDEIKQIIADEKFDAAIENRGVSLVSFVVESVTLTDESKKKIDDYELAGDQYQQQGVLTSAYANAVQDAAKNANGSMTGFMGIGMMGSTTGNPFGAVTSNIANSVNYGTPNQAGYNEAVKPTGAGEPNAAVVAGAGVATEPAPQADSWKCTCGTVNTGKFCSECGKSKEEAMPKARVCPKCGTEVAENAKFCPECGEKLGE